MLWVRIPLRQGVLDTTLCDQGTNKKMEQIIERSVLAINEHERLLSTITHIQIMENHFIDLLHFSHYRVFKNAHNLYPKMSVKRPLASILVADEAVLYFCRWTLHQVFFVSFWCYLVNRILFPRCFKIIYRWSNLTNTIIIYLPCF
jgi:hypothetical protein